MNFMCCRFLISLFFLALNLHADQQSASAAQPTPTKVTSDLSSLSARSKVVIVQPVILCDDDGTHAARNALPKRLIHQAYTRADLGFLYLPSVRWHHGKARRGEINLDAIVAEGRAKGVIAKDPAVLTLLFVSAVDGNVGPLGRGMQNGNVCFVCLGPEGEMPDPAMQAFVAAHEMGHCLNLKHVVDDPAVPNDIPNLEGDGTFAERIAVQGLHPTQVETILANRLCQSRVRFHTREESARLLSRDAWHNRPESLSDDGLRFQLGFSLDMVIPVDPQERDDFARKHFSNAAESFTSDEIELLQKRVAHLQQHLEAHDVFGGESGVFARIPWNFIKVKAKFCMGFPHTRGLAIVLTAPMIESLKNDETLFLTILLHEKMHLFQRLSPAHFTPAFRRYGYVRARLVDGEYARLKIVPNPDAPAPLWALKLDGKSYLIASSLEFNGGQYEFVERCYPLKSTPQGNVALAPIPTPENVKQWRDKFPVVNGLDDPRELNAYLADTIFSRGFSGESKQEFSLEHLNTLKKERLLLPKLLR